MEAEDEVIPLPDDLPNPANPDQPLLFYLDLKSARIPRGVDPLRIPMCIRRLYQSLGYTGPVDITIVVAERTDQNLAVQRRLLPLGVHFVVASDMGFEGDQAADQAIERLLIKRVLELQPPASFFIGSSDGDYQPLLNKVRKLNFNTGFVYRQGQGNLIDLSGPGGDRHPCWEIGQVLNFVPGVRPFLYGLEPRC